MTLSVPWGIVGFVASWCWRKVEKALFYKTYLHSHRRWTSKHGLGSFWERLGEHLEYSVYLAESTDAQPQEFKIALRAKQGTVNRFECVIVDVQCRVSIPWLVIAHDVKRFGRRTLEILAASWGQLRIFRKGCLLMIAA